MELLFHHTPIDVNEASHLYAEFVRASTVIDLDEHVLSFETQEG